MIIAAYKGKSWISKAIQWQTRGEYSHVAVQTRKGIIEAWHSPSKVRVIRDWGDGHSKGTEVDLFIVYCSPMQEQIITEFLLGEVGKKYDFVGVLRFMSRRNKNNPDRWFCSELVFAAFAAAGVDLLKRIQAYQVAPVTLVTSPELSLLRQVIT